MHFPNFQLTYKNIIRTIPFPVRRHTKNQRQKPKNRTRNIIWFNHHATKQDPQMLQEFFFDWSTDIFQSLIDYIKLSTETQWRLVTTVFKLCPKYKIGVIVRLHQHRVTKWRYHCTKMKFSIKDLVPFTEEIFNGKLYFFCSACNCRVNEECRMDGKCQTMEAV